MGCNEAVAPEPVTGLVVYDPIHPLQRWCVAGVARDDRIEAVRIKPTDGRRYSWSHSSWEAAWENGWLCLDRDASSVALPGTKKS